MCIYIYIYTYTYSHIYTFAHIYINTYKCYTHTHTHTHTHTWGFPHSVVGKETTCNAGEPSLISGSGRSTGEGISYPLQYSWASLVAQLVKNPPAIDLGSITGLGRSPREGKGLCIVSSQFLPTSPPWSWSGYCLRCVLNVQSKDGSWLWEAGKAPMRHWKPMRWLPAP